MTMQKIIISGRLSGWQRLRLLKLLDMLYTPGELAEEIGVDRRQMYRVYLPLGCPSSRDALRRWWINGKAFREWYEATYPRVRLKPEEAFCLTCRKAVRMAKPIRHKAEGLVYLVCKCAKCGRKLTKIVENKKQAA
jgi:hypothetical protein